MKLSINGSSDYVSTTVSSDDEFFDSLANTTEEAALPVFQEMHTDAPRPLTPTPDIFYQFDPERLERNLLPLFSENKDPIAHRLRARL